MRNSGKFVILGILTVALASAAASWWFRYSATHEAAQFWGPQNARLIRDAPHVALVRLILSEPPTTRDISRAPGMLHLRNALLEDRSFLWEQGIEAAPKNGGWKLAFSDPATGEQFTIRFTTDCRGAIDDSDPRGRAVSTAPIAKGLREIFAELSPDVSPR
jgi:hypothetical protein